MSIDKQNDRILIVVKNVIKEEPREDTGMEETFINSKRAEKRRLPPSTPFLEFEVRDIWNSGKLNPDASNNPSADFVSTGSSVFRNSKSTQGITGIISNLPPIVSVCEYSVPQKRIRLSTVERSASTDPRYKVQERSSSPRRQHILEESVRKATAGISAQQQPKCIRQQYIIIHKDTCWRCGRPGHYHKGCYRPAVLFCSLCGLLGVSSRYCTCRKSLPWPIRKSSTACPMCHRPF